MQSPTKPIASRTPHTPEPWHRVGFRSLLEEHTPTALEIFGTIPRGLVGTLYRNGPSRFEIFGHRMECWFDGDGMVHAFDISADRVRYRNRLVRTSAHEREVAAGKRLYGGYGTLPSGGWWHRFRHRGFRVPGNTNAVILGDQLLAMSEDGAPYSLSPDTLETVEQTHFGGLLRSGDTFSAHPCKDPITGRMWNFGVEYGLRSFLRLYELSEDGKGSTVASVKLPAPAMIHDFVVTETYALVVVSSWRLPTMPLAMLLGQRHFLDVARWDDSGSWVGIIRKSDGEVTWVRTPSMLVLHCINAYEQDGVIQLDVCAYEDDRVAGLVRDVMRDDRRPRRAAAHPRRISLRWGETHPLSMIELSQTSLEFPTVAAEVQGTRHRVAYGLTWPETHDFWAEPVALDLETRAVTRHSLPPWQFAGELIPVQKADLHEDSACWLLTVVLDAKLHHSELWILDGERIEDPPIARVRAPCAIPLGFHGSWRARSRVG